MKTKKITTTLLALLSLVAQAAAATYSGTLDKGELKGVAFLEKGTVEPKIVLKGTTSSGEWAFIDLVLWDAERDKWLIIHTGGITFAKNKTRFTYRGMEIEWSGWGGEGGVDGYEILRVKGITTRKLGIGVYGYGAGKYSVKITKETSRNSGLAWPLPSKYRDISQRFGDEWSANKSKRHTGIDIPAPEGTSVVAVADGKITRKGNLGGTWGEYVIVNDGKFDYCYLHLRNISVKVGSSVTKGKAIAEVYDDHLHFGMRSTGKTDNISPRGALPKVAGTAGSDPQFPELFVNPLDYLKR